MSSKKRNKQVEIKLFVARGASVLSLDRRNHWTEGQEVKVDEQATSRHSRGALHPSQVERLKKIGYLVENEQEVKEASAPAGVPDVPALPTATPGNEIDVDADPKKVANVQPAESEGRAEAQAKAAKDGSAKAAREKGRGNQKAISIWNLDPERLKGQSLASLNAIIKDKDATLEPFTDLDEAVAWLSQDFKPASK